MYKQKFTMNQVDRQSEQTDNLVRGARLAGSRVVADYFTSGCHRGLGLT